jgi:hypothetical protein
MEREAMDRSFGQRNSLVNQSTFIPPVFRPAGQAQGGAAA